METMFGQYRLEELIGRGGMGEVYRAYDTDAQRLVAIKRLPVRLGADAEFERRFRRECDTVAALDHPHIVAVHGFGEIDGQLFLDMELIDGPDLGTLLSRHGPLSAERAVEIVGQVADALDAAHAKGVVHRDVKPANVLIASCDGHDVASVADFGLARAMSEGSSSLTSTGTAVGSMAYMAPERFTGGHGDHRADIYALACLLFEALTARPPFMGEGLPAMVHAHLHLDPPRPSAHAANVAPRLDAVIAHGMAKNPESRYSSAGDLANDARAAITGKPLTALTQATSSPGTAQRRRPRPAIAVPLTVAAVLAVAGLTLLGVSTDRAQAIPNQPGASGPTSTTPPTPGSYAYDPTPDESTPSGLAPSPQATTPDPEQSQATTPVVLPPPPTIPPPPPSSPPPSLPPSTPPLAQFSSVVPTTPAPPQQPPRILATSTYTQGPLIYLRVQYTDDDGDAQGFGFRGVNGSGWAAESHPFNSPSFGRVSPGQVEYPFNHNCGSPNAIETDVQFWIYDSGNRRGSVTVHLSCG